MKRFLAIVIPLLLLLTLVGWRFIQKTSADAANKKASAAARNAPTVVQLSTARRMKISEHINGVGSLESPFTVKLSPNVAGRIDYLQVREGDEVKKGQVLIRIDPQQVEAIIAQARANLAQAQQNLVKAQITQSSTATGINSTISQNKALVASTGADYNETAVTYDPTVNAAHEATVDAQQKVTASQYQLQTSTANLNLAEANLEDAKAKYTRELDLYKHGFAAAQDIDDALASEKVNEATVNAQQKQVNASQSALISAEEEEKAAANQEAITRKKGMSDIQDAKAKWTQSKATLETAVSNRAQIPAYVENLRALESAVHAAQGSLNQALAERAFLVVKSSIDGTVTQRLFDPGAEATPGSPILVLNFLRWLYVTVSLPIEDSDSVRPDMDVRLAIDSLPGREFHTKIVDVNRAGDPTVRQFMVRLKMDNSEHLLRPGMYARIYFDTSTVEAPVAVPREAVAQKKNGTYTVTVVDDNKVAHVTPVTLGAQNPNDIQILSGVSAGQKVVVLSYRAIKDGAKVVTGRIGKGSLGDIGGRRGGGAGENAATQGGGQGGAGPLGGDQDFNEPSSPSSTPTIENGRNSPGQSGSTPAGASVSGSAAGAAGGSAGTRGR